MRQPTEGDACDDPDFDETDGTAIITTYMLTDGCMLATLGCWFPVRAEGDWLALAETIEYLPEEE